MKIAQSKYGKYFFAVFLLFGLTAYVSAQTENAAILTIAPHQNGSDALVADPAVQNLKMVDGIDRFQRKYFLRNAEIKIQAWVDDRRILAQVLDRDSNKSHPELDIESWILFDTETGGVERLPWGRKTTVECLVNGRIVLSEPMSSDWRGPKMWHIGTFGQKLKTYIKQAGYSGYPEEWKAIGELDRSSCQFVKRLQNREQSKKIASGYLPSGHTSINFIHVDYLEAEHGWLVETHPWRAEKMPRISDYFHLKADGLLARIQTTTGERTFSNSPYLTFADGYFSYPELHFGDPHHVWTTHFARLIHPDGRVERFSIPGPLMNQIITHHENVWAQFTRKGPLWKLLVHSLNKDSAQMQGAYLVIGGELVRVAQHIESISPNGCKLAGWKERTWEQLNDVRNYKTHDPYDYFVIDLCKE
jgi:hypothetical protein